MDLHQLFSRKKIFSSFIPMAGIFSIAFSINSFANTSKHESSNSKTLIAQTNSVINSDAPPAVPSTELDTQFKDKPNPVEAVEGALGKGHVKAPDYAVLPTGKTLPKGIFRAKFVGAYTFSDFGFDEDGKQAKNGIDYARWMSGVEVQYGLSNSVSLAVGIPYVNSNHSSIDATAFTSNELYKKYYNKFVNLIATKLSLTPGSGCTSVAVCTAAINAGARPAASSPIVLPTGEIATLKSTASIKDQIHDFVIAAAAPSNGATGIGDIQIGALWNVISEDSPIRHVPMFLSIGGGLRLPTGNFDIPSGLRATGGDGTLITGGGTYDALLRWNLDYVATPGVILSWQHQMEYSLTSANLGRTSMLNPTQKNTQDASAAHSGITGDTVGNTLKFSRKGLHQIGFLEAAWGVGNMFEEMKWLGLFSQAKYNIAAQAYLNDEPIYAMADQFFLNDSSLHTDHGAEQYYSAVLGSKISGLPYMLPVEGSIEFEYPFYGKNRIASPMNAQASLSLYF